MPLARRCTEEATDGIYGVFGRVDEVYPLLLADDWEDRSEDDDRRRHKSRIPLPSSSNVDDGMSGQGKKRENAVVEWLIGTKTQT